MNVVHHDKTYRPGSPGNWGPMLERKAIEEYGRVPLWFDTASLTTDLVTPAEDLSLPTHVMNIGVIQANRPTLSALS